jgi:polygalacturonase
MTQGVGSHDVTLDAKKFGVKDDGLTLNTAALQRALDEANEAGGGTVQLTAGRYLTGPVKMHSHTTLQLDAGAILLASRRARDYPLISARWEGRSQVIPQPLIYAVGEEDVAVVGAGTVEGRGVTWWAAHRAGKLKNGRPRLLAFEGCVDVRVEGIRLQNSPSWTIHPYGCKNVKISDVTIENPANSPNTDGVDPESCTGVTIVGCRISSGDDCIAIKSGVEEDTRLGPCEGIVVSRCTLDRGHGAVVVGSEMSGGVRNVTVADCVFRGTDRGFRFKTRRGRGGVIEGFRATNVTMDGVGTPLAINMYYIHTGPGGRDASVQDRGPQPVTRATPVVRDIRLSHVTAERASCAAAFILGLPESPVADLSLEDVTLGVAPGARPTEPEMAMDVPPMAGAGFHCTNATGVRMERVSVTGQSGPPLVLENVSLRAEGD